jgi:hypothetical protein
MDVTFRARIAVLGIEPGPRAEKIVVIPVFRDWRPTVDGRVSTYLVPSRCDARDLRWFPEEIRRRHADRALTLADLLSVGDATLRLYMFAYRPYVGTRFMVRGRYDKTALIPGLYEGGEVVPAADQIPPVQPELEADEGTSLLQVDTAAPESKLAAISIGRWNLELRRN